LRTLGMPDRPADKKKRQDANGPSVSVQNHARTISLDLSAGALAEAETFCGEHQ
jgi:hypothetical protein